MGDEADDDRWAIGDLRDRSQTPRVDHFLARPDPRPTKPDETLTELERLKQRVQELEHRLREQAGPISSSATGYTLFFRGTRGYEVVDGDGASPAIGTPVIVEGQRFVVEAIRRSPFPSDKRPCLVLSPPHGAVTISHTGTGY